MALYSLGVWNIVLTCVHYYNITQHSPAAHPCPLCTTCLSSLPRPLVRSPGNRRNHTPSASLLCGGSSTPACLLHIHEPPALDLSSRTALQGAPTATALSTGCPGLLSPPHPSLPSFCRREHVTTHTHEPYDTFVSCPLLGSPGIASPFAWPQLQRQQPLTRGLPERLSRMFLTALF